MLIDHLIISVVVIMTPGIAAGVVHHVKVVRANSTNSPVRVSCRVPVVWLGKLHSGKTGAGPQ